MYGEFTHSPRPQVVSVSAEWWLRPSETPSGLTTSGELKPVQTPLAILGSLGVCIYVPASRHWLISYSPIQLT